MLKDLLYVSVGGGIGSALRYIISRLVLKYTYGTLMFLGTFAANILGSF